MPFTKKKVTPTTDWDLFFARVITKCCLRQEATYPEIKNLVSPVSKVYTFQYEQGRTSLSTFRHCRYLRQYLAGIREGKPTQRALETTSVIMAELIYVCTLVSLTNAAVSLGSIGMGDERAASMTALGRDVERRRLPLHAWRLEWTYLCIEKLIYWRQPPS